MPKLHARFGFAVIVCLGVAAIAPAASSAAFFSANGSGLGSFQASAGEANVVAVSVDGGGTLTITDTSTPITGLDGNGCTIAAGIVTCTPASLTRLDFNLDDMDDDLTVTGLQTTTTETVVFGAAGADDIDYSAVTHQVTISFMSGGAGADEIVGTPTSTQGLLYGNTHNPVDPDDGAVDTVTGGPGKEEIQGGFGNDILNGGGGPDTILPGQGDDVAAGGAGNDNITEVLSGSPVPAGGNDTIDGGDDGDIINAGIGSDSITGGAGNDQIAGGDLSGVLPDVADTIGGGAGDDTIFPGEGNDIANGDGGADIIGESLESDGGNDQLNGGDGNDALQSGVGSDSLDGGAGDDLLSPYQGVPIPPSPGSPPPILGPTPDDGVPDVLVCGAGNDTAFTGPGDIMSADCENSTQTLTCPTSASGPCQMSAEITAPATGGGAATAKKGKKRSKTVSLGKTKPTRVPRGGSKTIAVRLKPGGVNRALRGRSQTGATIKMSGTTGKGKKRKRVPQKRIRFTLKK